MLARCTQPSHVHYAEYGARGIAVCDRWQGFQEFLADMGERPAGTSLDRIDNDRGYSADNCRWATKKQQARNKSHNVRAEFCGITKLVVEWAEMYDIPYAVLYRRLKRGRSMLEALTDDAQQMALTALQ